MTTTTALESSPIDRFAASTLTTKSWPYPERMWLVRYNFLVAVPKDIPDRIAAQMLINTITASALIKAGHNAI
jgi:hypothetical protein